MHADTAIVQDSMLTSIGMVHYSIDSAFHSFGKIMFRPENDEYTLKAGNAFTLKATVDAPQFFRQYLNTNRNLNYPVKLGVFDAQNWLYDMSLDVTLQGALQQNEITLSLAPDLKKGTYFLRFAVGSDAGWFTHNSEKIKLVIE